MPPGGGGGGGSGPEGGNGDEEARRNKAKLLGLAAAAVAVSGVFVLVPNAHADEDGEHHARMSITEIAEWVIEHALFSVRLPKAQTCSHPMLLRPHMLCAACSAPRAPALRVPHR